MKMLFGGILLAVGGLIALASGLCSGWVFLSTIAGSSGGSGADALFFLPWILIIGGIPFMIGLGLFLWGRYLVRSAQNEPRE